MFGEPDQLLELDNLGDRDHSPVLAASCVSPGPLEIGHTLVSEVGMSSGLHLHSMIQHDQARTWVVGDREAAAAEEDHNWRSLKAKRMMVNQKLLLQV